MWVKNTEAEIAREQSREKRSRLKSAIVCGALIVILGSFLFGWKEGSARGQFTVAREEIPRRLPVSILLGILSGFFVYRFYKSPTSRSMICPKCESMKTPGAEETCSCGGKYQKLTHMKWIP
jgi:hypothetical protein